LRFVENPRDQIAGFRLMQILPGVGPASAQTVLDGMATAAEPFQALAESPLPPRADKDWLGFVATILELAARKAGWPTELERACLWYEPHLDRIYEDAMVRRADLIQLSQIATTFPSRERFLTELTLDPPDASSDRAGVPLRDEDYLVLSTIHSAKGQEWRSVFVLNAVDGCIPSDLGAGTTSELEEERRLLYVAMTRAKDELHLIAPQRFFTHQQATSGDRHVYASRSRFLPNTVLSFFDTRAWPPVDEHPNRTASSNTYLDVGARMRAMWRSG
jgi:DNA helicase II / ATP-dependent DNA helicase PcrA